MSKILAIIIVGIIVSVFAYNLGVMIGKDRAYKTVPTHIQIEHKYGNHSIFINHTIPKISDGHAFTTKSPS